MGPLSAYGTQGDDTVIRLWFLSPRFIHRQILTIQIKQMTTKREREVENKKSNKRGNEQKKTQKNLNIKSQDTLHN